MPPKIMQLIHRRRDHASHCVSGAVRCHLENIVRRAAVLLLLFTVFTCVTAQSGNIDADDDGLPDILENRLIERFEPRFMLSAEDCDLMPAEFQPGIMEPVAIARNGTIYAQVFPVALPERDGAWAEVHYYHLWANSSVSGVAAATTARMPFGFQFQ